MAFDRATVRTQFDSPLGTITLAATSLGLAGVWFNGQRHQPDWTAWREDDQHPVLQRAVRQLRAYLARERRVFELPLDLRAGTAFQQSVWRALVQIAPGSTCSYGTVAARLGKPSAVRAVGAAIGRNPISIVVPCHRVLGASGALTGYAGGLERKAALLALETGAALDAVDACALAANASAATIASE